MTLNFNIDGLVQERRNSIANALELRLSCTNPSIFGGHLINFCVSSTKVLEASDYVCFQ